MGQNPINRPEVALANLKGTLYCFPDPVDSAGVLRSMNTGELVNSYPAMYQGRPGQAFDIPDNGSFPNGNGATITFSHPGKDDRREDGILYYKSDVPNFPWFTGQNTLWAGDFFPLQDSIPFPTNPPSRMEVLSVNMHFRGGLIVDSPVYGRMPWYDSCLSWCDSETRKRAYVVKKTAGDTHAIIHIPSGKPLYDEYGLNFYNPNRFPALDWTNGLTEMSPQFINLVYEVIAAGFKIIVTMDEVFDQSIQIVQLAMRALRSHNAYRWCIVLPGYDGVFYGWPDDQVTIPYWASLARAIKPDCILGIEFNVGHIPLGNEVSDYLPGGKMSGYDAVFGEFPTLDPRPTLETQGDDIWQIAPRINRPYNRPPEQPSWDDPDPPFYLVDSERGPRVAVFFETQQPYQWVRVNMQDQGAVNRIIQSIDKERHYMIEIGGKYFG